jgi:hypothetical protein
MLLLIGNAIFSKPIFTLIILFAVFTAAPASAQDITLAWDPNEDPDTAGYRVYYGTRSGYYTQVINVGESTICSVPDLSPARTYYFAVTAYDINNIESGFSAELKLDRRHSPPGWLTVLLLNDEEPPPRN